MTTLYADPAVLVERMMRRVEKREDGCWVFTGCVNSRGYGCVGAGKKGKTILAHRLAVIADGREIPDGMTVDHECHDSMKCPDPQECSHRRCVNPEHLAVVTNGENSRRRYEDGLCRKGHALIYRTRGVGKARECRTCHRDRVRAGVAERKAS